MNTWISTITRYLNKFLEVGVLLLAVSVVAEILFGPDVPFFGSQVTNNLINLGLEIEEFLWNEFLRIQDNK